MLSSCPPIYAPEPLDNGGQGKGYTESADEADMRQKRVRPTPQKRLARVLMESLTAAWVKHNPTHDNPDFEAIKRLGVNRGYLHVAEELIARGIKLPSEPLS